MFFLRNRLQAGNLCLVLFIAFLFTVLFGTAGWDGKAAVLAAAEPLDDKVVSQSATVDGQKVTVEITLRPITQAQFATVLAHLRILDALGTQIVDTHVYGSIYESWNVQAGVYQALLRIVYDVPAGIEVPSVLTFVYRSVYGDIGAQSVYLDLILKPPELPPPAPAPPPPAPAPGITVRETGTGTETVDLNTGTAFLKVDRDRVAQQLADPRRPPSAPLGIRFSGDAAAQPNRNIGLPRGVLEDSNRHKVPIEVEFGPDFSLQLPASFLRDIPELAGTSPGATLSLGLRPPTEEEKAAMPAIPKGMAGASGIYVFSLAIQDGNVTRHVSLLATPIELGARYTLAPGINEQALGLYRRGSWIYVGGRVDTANRKVWAPVRQAGEYRVLAYDKTFADIAGHWAEADIRIIASKHVAKGVTENEYWPEAPVTRAQFATFIKRVLQLPDAFTMDPLFKDVSRDAWFYVAVETVARAGIAEGYAGYFRPNDQITREEMAAMIVRAMKVAGREINVITSEEIELLARFKDKDEISAWAKNVAAVAVKAGIVRGREIDRFAPKASTTRAETAVMLKRLMAYLRLI